MMNLDKPKPILSLGHLARDHWLFPNSPGAQRNVARRDVIRMTCKVTGSATKLIPASPVCFFDVPATRALSARVTSIHHKDSNTKSLRFVLDKELKLRKPPVME